MSNKELNWGIQDVDAEILDHLDNLQNPHLFEDPITISNGDDMDTNIASTNCDAKINQFCMFETSNCYLENDGRKGVSASALPMFNDLYPECSGNSITSEDAESIFNPENTTVEGFLNPKSTNFLGGEKMRKCILIILAVVVLLKLSGGKPIKATAKAIKKAV